MTRILRLPDPTLFILSLLATIIGLLFVFDAGYARSLLDGKGTVPPEFKNQILFFGVAIVASFVVSQFKTTFWQKGSKVIWTLCLALLLAVEFAGVEMNGAKRWIALGPINFQPAEFAKIATVLYLAGYFANRKKWPEKIPPRRDFDHWLTTIAWPKFIRSLPIVWVGLAFILIEIEPDLGTGAVLAATAFAMLWPGGVSRKSFGALLLIGVVGVTAMVVKQPYRVERITNHVHRWEGGNADEIGFQTVQSEAAMADGGVLGVGLGNGRAKHILPATTTDFIMATIGEESGLVGSLTILGLIGAIVARLYVLATRAKSRFSMLVLLGVAAWIGIQATINVMMANGFLPAIGIPLPFISSGGSSLLALWIALGVCQSVAAPVTVKGEEVAADSNRRRNWRARLSRA